MATSIVDEWTDKLRESRFGQDVFGPRVARPLARWLTTNFDDPAEVGTGSSAITSVAPGFVDGVADIGVADVGVAGEGGADSALPSSPSVPLGHQDRADPVLANGDTSEREIEAMQASGSDSIFARFIAAAKDLSRRIKVHNLVVVAAGIAFWGLLAIPATLVAIVSIAGLVLDPATVRSQVEDNLSGLPEEAQTIIGDQLEGVSGGNTGGLIAGVAVGIALALWTSSGAMAKLLGTLNTIYDTTESRNFFKLRGTAIGLTFGGIVFLSSAIFLLAVLPAVLGSIEGVGDVAQTLFSVLRFPILGLVMVIALGVLYHVGPDRTAKYRPLTIGALVAMVLWIGLSGLFSIYTATAGSYNETYGSIAGIVILLLWLFITAFTVLIGAELHAQSEGPRPDSAPV